MTTHTYALDDALLGTAWTNAAIATPSVGYTYDADYARVATMVDGIGAAGYTCRGREETELPGMSAGQVGVVACALGKRANQLLAISARMKTHFDNAHRCGLIAWVVLTACQCGHRVDGIPREIRLPSNHQVRQLTAAVDAADRSVQIEYESVTSVRDCAAIQAEVLELWNGSVQKYAEQAGATKVVVWPTDGSGSAISLSWRRSAGGEWVKQSDFVKCS